MTEEKTPCRIKKEPADNPLHLFNTHTRRKERFVPRTPGRVGLYVCGPTVYDTAHLGNARPYVVFDLLYRVLKTHYPNVCYVRNITDIDDKIIQRARENGMDIAALTQKTAEQFQQDMTALGLLPPDAQPRATQYVASMVQLIKILVHKGHAYEAQGHVLFRIRSFTSYGQLSRRSLEDMRAGARVEVAPYKEDPGDFVLWKPSDNQTPGWESPWGWGRPGWHIECSAMSADLLGVPFDIHGGGQDLIFPHHENELAQSCAAHNLESLATLWMHNGILTVNGEKMAKSLGNFITVPQVLERYPGEVVRWALLSTHYRQPLNWTTQLCEQARANLDRFYTLFSHDPGDASSCAVDQGVIQALGDDLNTPLAFHRLHQLATHASSAPTPAQRQQRIQCLKVTGQYLGFFNHCAQGWLHQDWAQHGLSPQTIETFIQQRADARRAKDYTQADRLRDYLQDQNVILEDQLGKTTWRRR